MANADQKGFFHRGEGRSYQLGRITMIFKADDPDAGYSVCETLSHPGGIGASLHRHVTYEETHIVIEGEYEFRLGEEVFRLGPGGMAFMPKGIVHSSTKLNDGIGRQLIVSSPAGVFEAFIAEASVAPSAEFRSIAAKHGVEFVNPPAP